MKPYKWFIHVLVFNHRVTALESQCWHWEHGTSWPLFNLISWVLTEAEGRDDMLCTLSLTINAYCGSLRPYLHARRTWRSCFDLWPVCQAGGCLIIHVFKLWLFTLGGKKKCLDWQGISNRNFHACGKESNFKLVKLNRLSYNIWCFVSDYSINWALLPSGGLSGHQKSEE